MANQIIDYSTVWPEDFFLEDEEEMSESDDQHYLISYLVSVLSYLFREEGWYIVGNLMIVQPGYSNIAPDVTAIRARKGRRTRSSWTINPPEQPAPFVVFEVASEGTWQVDLNEKVVRYAQMGVEEYYAYDPTEPRTWRGETNRLKGWRYANGVAVPLQPDPTHNGWLWSEALDSWLGEDGAYLRLYDREGNLRPDDKLRANRAERQAEIERRARERAERQAHLAEQRTRELVEQTTQRTRELLEQQAEVAKQVEAERQARELAEQRTRELSEQQTQAAKQIEAERQARAALEAELQKIKEQLRRQENKPDKQA